MHRRRLTTWRALLLSVLLPVLTVGGGSAHACGTDHACGAAESQIALAELAELAQAAERAVPAPAGDGCCHAEPVTIAACCETVPVAMGCDSADPCACCAAPSEAPPATEPAAPPGVDAVPVPALAVLAAGAPAPRRTCTLEQAPPLRRYLLSPTGTRAPPAG